MYSDIVAILAASVPSQMAMVTVTDNSGLPSVRVTWATPTENGSTVSAYEIKLLSSTAGVYYEITAECDGSTATTVAN